MKLADNFTAEIIRDKERELCQNDTFMAFWIGKKLTEEQQ